MTPEQFTYWLQGFTEICGDCPTDQQWQVIKDHLAAVFHKVTPDYTPQPYYIPPTYPMPGTGETTCHTTPATGGTYV
jgi:hypothetical protein